MHSKEEILGYIAGFRKKDKDGVIVKLFTEGYCYQFARLLDDRFLGAHIQYEPIMGHFVTEIDGRLYDIRGDVTDLYSYAKVWYSEDYCFEFPSIVDGCMLKVSDRPSA